MAIPNNITDTPAETIAIVQWNKRGEVIGSRLTETPRHGEFEDVVRDFWRDDTKLCLVVSTMHQLNAWLEAADICGKPLPVTSPAHCLTIYAHKP
jgi:hypothetical protein